MFFSIIKKVSLKKNVKKYLSTGTTSSGDKITTVNLLIDGTHFNETTRLIEEFVKNGIKLENINVLVLVKNKAILDTERITYFRPTDITLSGKVSKDKINSFILKKRDLLVSYYQSKEINLDYIALKSTTDFKVGFWRADKNPNQLTINSSLADYKLFTEELFKYLKALNKV